MRIVFLTHNFPRWPGDVSGAFLASLGSALVERGHDVRVIAPADEGKTGRMKFDGMSVRRVRYATPERETIAYRGTMTSAVKTVRGFRTFVGLVKAMRSAAREEPGIQLGQQSLASRETSAAIFATRQQIGHGPVGVRDVPAAGLEYFG